MSDWQELKDRSKLDPGNVSDADFLAWLLDRCEYVYGEPTNCAWMLRLANIYAAAKARESPRNPE